MSKFCPEWIYSTFAAQTSKEFLSSNNSIAAISRKYSTAISERFNEVKFEEIMDLAEKILQFLSEINAKLGKKYFLLRFHEHLPRISYKLKKQKNTEISKFQVKPSKSSENPMFANNKLSLNIYHF